MYILIEAADSVELRAQVEANLAVGWELVGGIALANLGDGDFLYAQAMAKEAE